jgi:Flp pilus assembly pilin Flp
MTGFWKSGRGVSLTGYALLVGLVGVVVLGTLGTLGDTIGELYDEVSEDIGSGPDSGGGGGGGSGEPPAPADTEPDAFSFADVEDADPGEVVTATSPVSGFTGPLTATASAGLDIRKSGEGDFGPTLEGVMPGDTIEIRATASASHDGTVTGTVSLGDTVSASWTVTTRSFDAVPDGFSFADVTGAALSAVTVSNAVTVGGFDGTLTATPGAGVMVSLNGGSFADSATGVQAGDTLALRVQASNAANTPVTGSVTLGSVTSGTWTVTTQADSVPDGFSFADVNNAPAAAATVSAPVTVGGFDGTLKAAASTGIYLRRNGTGGFSPIVTAVAPGDSLEARITSSASAGGSVTGTVSLGGVSSPLWTVTTAADITPPSISSVASPTSGALVPGNTIEVQVTFSETVVVTGAPRVGLRLGVASNPRTRYADYVSGSGGTVLVFRYTVSQGDFTGDGFTIYSPVRLNQGTIKDGTGNAALLTFTDVVVPGATIACTNITNQQVFVFDEPTASYLSWHIPCGTYGTIEFEVWGAGGAGGPAGGGGGGGGASSPSQSGCNGGNGPDLWAASYTNSDGEDSYVKDKNGSTILIARGGDYGSPGLNGHAGTGNVYNRSYFGFPGGGGSGGAGGSGGPANANGTAFGLTMLSNIAPQNGTSGGTGATGGVGGGASGGGGVGGGAGFGGTGGIGANGIGNGGDGAHGGGGGYGGLGYTFNPFEKGGGGAGDGGGGGGGQSGGYMHADNYHITGTITTYSPLRVYVGQGGVSPSYGDTWVAARGAGAGCVNPGQEGSIPGAPAGGDGGNGRVVIRVYP